MRERMFERMLKDPSFIGMTPASSENYCHSERSGAE